LFLKLTWLFFITHNFLIKSQCCVTTNHSSSNHNHTRSRHSFVSIWAHLWNKINIQTIQMFTMLNLFWFTLMFTFVRWPSKCAQHYSARLNFILVTLQGIINTLRKIRRLNLNHLRKMFLPFRYSSDVEYPIAPFTCREAVLYFLKSLWIMLI